MPPLIRLPCIPSLSVCLFALSFRSRPTILRCAFLPSTGTLRTARKRGSQGLPFCPNALRRRVPRLAGDGQRVHPDAPEPATILGQRVWDTSQRRHSVGMASLIALCGTIRGGKRDLTPWMRAHGAPLRHCPRSSAVRKRAGQAATASRASPRVSRDPAPAHDGREANHDSLTITNLARSILLAFPRLAQPLLLAARRRCPSYRR